MLMVSGVGPAATLNGLGIDVVSDLQGVGQNLEVCIDMLAVRTGSDNKSLGSTILSPDLSNQRDNPAAARQPSLQPTGHQ